MSDQDDPADRAGRFSKQHLDALEKIRISTTFLWQSLVNLPEEDDRLVCPVRKNTYESLQDAIVTLEKAGYFKASVRIKEKPKGWKNHAASPARQGLLLTLEDITPEFKRSVVSHFKGFGKEPSGILTPEKQVRVRQLAEMPTRPGSFVASNTTPLHQLHCAPLALSEIIPASRYYPVLFPKGGKEQNLALAPVALFSLSSEDGNAYIDADGRWTVPFIPYYLRQPLDPAEFSENPSGEAVSRGGGVDKQEDGLWRFKKERKECAQLATLLHNTFELCEEPVGQKCADAYRVVSEERLAELPKEKFLALWNRGLLPYIYAHLSSLEHLHGLQLRASLPEQPVEDHIFRFEHSVTAYPVEKGPMEKRLPSLLDISQKLTNSHVWMWRFVGVGALLLVVKIGWTTLFSPPLISEAETASVRVGSPVLQNEPGQPRLMDDMPGQSKKSTEKGVFHRAGNPIEPVVRQIEKPAVNVIKIGAGETALEEARQNAVEQNNSVPEAHLPAITQSETVPSVVPLKNTRSVKEKSQHKLAAPRQSKFAGGQVKVVEKMHRNISSTSTSSQKMDTLLTDKTKYQDKQLDRKQLESGPSERVIDKPDAVANMLPKESPSKVKVAADILNMRILPDVQRAVVARLEKGTVLKVIGLEKAWLQVETSDGRTGWVAGHLTTDLRTGRRAQAPL